MRNHYNTIKQELGQFLTPAPIANLLARLLPRGGVSQLELGAGDGALLTAVGAKLNGLEITAVECDRSLRARLRKKQLVNELIAGDAASPAILRRLASRAPFDYVVGNPPYALGANTETSIDLLNEMGLYDVQRGVRLDTLFLAQSISLMASSGAGAFILPMPLFTDMSYAPFRLALLQRFSNLTVVELPPDTFGQAEVSTAICAFHGMGVKRKKIKLATANTQGILEASLNIGEPQAAYRMDYSFHKERILLDGLLGMAPHSLRSIGAKVVRGSATSLDMKANGIQYLHTSDLPPSGIARLSFKGKADERFQHASAGDIVVPRVGTRCLYRQGVVLKGDVPFTESIFRIRVESEFRDTVLSSLASPIGQSWRKLHARGACAKHITAADLYDFPLIGC